MAGTTKARTANSRSTSKSSSSRNTSSRNGSSSRTSSSRTSKPAASRSKANAEPQSKFHTLFMEELKDIYWAEKNLVKALPKMMKAATSEELAEAIGEHVEITKEHVARVEQIFEMMGARAAAKKCEAMEGLIAEGQEVVQDTEEDSAVRDAGIIIASQKIEHYEIAAYGSLRALANKMGQSEVVSLLEQTLGEEKNADQMLTQIAESSINEEASAE